MEAGVSTGRERERRGFGVQGQQRGEAVKGEEARAAATQVHCVAGIAKAPANPLQNPNSACKRERRVLAR